MKKVVYSIAFVHLLFITLTIFHVFDNLYNKNAVVEKSFAFICSLNYSVWRYGFFSPDVGNSNEIEIIVYDTTGRARKLSTLHGFNFFLSNADLGKRFYGFKVYNAADTLLQDLCARSVAAKMMNVYPDVYKVTYTLRSIRYPVMEKYRKKDTVAIHELYSTDFVLRNR
jgi:hypothetical protein